MPKHNRYSVLFALFALFTALTQFDNRLFAQGKRPNVLILMNDDMSRHCVGATGGQQALTPNIDAIAKRGTVMQNVVHQGAFSGAICTCSRAMMLTGRALWTVTPNFNYKAPAQLKTPDILYPEQFRNEGWQTFGTGKWHNGNAALLRSFDHAEAITGGMLPFNERDRGGAKDNAIEIGMMNPQCNRISNSGEVEKHGSQGWSTDVFYDAAETFIDETWDREKPFMMYISTNAPHDPRHVPDDILARFKNVVEPPNYRSTHPFDNGHMNVRDELVYKPPHSPETVRRERAIYLAMCAQIDDRIGRLIAKLDSIGQLENTIILFTSDHGLAVGEHGLLGKQNLYDGSWRVPMILAGPGIPKGETRDGFAYLHGIFPTLADFAGIEAPEHSKDLVLRRPFAEKATDCQRCSVLTRPTPSPIAAFEQPDLATSSYCTTRTANESNCSTSWTTPGK